MFYAHFVLAKKGPLARIWLAAHWDKKLTKAHVFETNIESSVEGIIQPKVKMALRTSGHLLLGIVRIYSRKAKYLLADCNEAFIKIKIAFRPGVVDLPEGNREAAVAAITLPEVFHDFDSALPDITIDMDAQVSLNQSRAEDITLKEDYGNLSLVPDDGFDDMGFDEHEAGRDAGNMEDGFDDASLLICGAEGSTEQHDQNAAGVSGAKSKVPMDTPLKDDGFGGTVGEGLLDGNTGVLFEPTGLFDDAPLGTGELDQATAEPSMEAIDKVPPPPAAADDDSDDDMYDMAPGSVGAPSLPSSPESPHLNPDDNNIPEPATVPSRSDDHVLANYGMDVPATSSDPVPDFSPGPSAGMPPPIAPPQPHLDHTTLINNDAESFALAPLDATIVHGGIERAVKAKRKRKLVVDEVKSISGEEMKSQLSDTTDIVATLDLAPPTKRLMHWKETGGVEKLFSLPGHRILSRTISRAYLRHLTTRSVENEKVGEEDDQADLEQQQEIAHQADLEPPHENIHQADESQHENVMDELSAMHPPKRTRYSGREATNVHQEYPAELPMSHPAQAPYAHHAALDRLVQFSGVGDDLPHLPEHMQGDQGPPLHSITPSIPNDALPVHSTDHIFENIPLPASVDHLALQHPGETMHHAHRDLLQIPQIDAPTLSNVVDDDATQLCLEDPFIANRCAPEPPFSAPPEVPHSRMISNGTVHVPETHAPSAPITNHQPTLADTASNSLFDSLIPHVVPQTQNMQPPLENHQGDHDLQMGQNQSSELVMSDDDDYGAPASVGPAMPDEQQADETYEQFEERILTKRTTHLLHMIHNHLEDGKIVSFEDLVRNNRRKQVAQKFYTFLVLKKQQAVELEQEPYGDLKVSKGPKFDAVYNSN